MPLWSPCSMGPGGRTKSPPRSPHILTEAGRRRRTDQTLAPTFLTDEGHHSRQPAQPTMRDRQVHRLQAPCYRANLNTRGRRSQRSSNRLHPSDGCRCCKEHSKKVRFVRPGQSEAEQGDQRNYGELPYVGVQSLLSTLPRAQVSFELNEPRGAKCGTTSCRRRAASTLSARSISRPQIKVTADEVRSFLPCLGPTRNDAPSAL